ncbi:EAL domain-containing protein [Eubacterium aggregans]|uniref:EAL domain-containing protein n=1 Tax=Eubacterium aggregans TaxID=81409 RepID=UPI003F2B917B
MESSEKGFLSPGVFIPIFERNGFITDLDIYIWDQCCQKIRAWIDKGNHATPLSVNVSRADIYRPDLVDILLSVIKKYKLSPKYLHLEITETAYTENPEQLIDVLTQLKKLGFIIEMDDFGSGYSSLNMLSELPIDILKLDMKFIQGNKHANSRNILSFIISLAKWMNLSVIAEGVETEEQVQLLQLFNCEFAQGYYYAKPLPQEEFEALLLRSGFRKKAKNPAEQLLLSDKKTEKSTAKTMLILDMESSDYRAFPDYYKDLYNVIQVYRTSEAADFISQLKGNTALLVINGMDIKTIDEIEDIVNVCKPHNIPTILLQDTMNDFVNQAAQAGITDYLLKPYYTDSFHLRVKNVINRARILEFEREKEINAVILEMKKRAEQDSLTGLLNRAEFEDRINKFYYQNQSPDGIFIILDIDNFKKVNDALGHMTGDKVLCATAERLNQLFFQTNMISRMGGDEFAVFIPYKFEMDDLCSRMEKLCHALSFEIAEFPIFCSAGVCTSPENGLDFEQLYYNADMALLTAKKDGKHQYRIFVEGMNAPNKEQIEVKAALLLDDVSDAMFVCDAVTSEIIFINDTGLSNCWPNQTKVYGR